MALNVNGGTDEVESGYYLTCLRGGGGEVVECTGFNN